MNFAYNGTAVEVVDEESHRDEEMVKVVGEDVDRWVFVDDLDELPGGTPEGAVALDEGRTPEEIAELDVEQPTWTQGSVTDE